MGRGNLVVVTGYIVIVAGSALVLWDLLPALFFLSSNLPCMAHMHGTILHTHTHTHTHIYIYIYHINIYVCVCVCVCVCV